MVTTKVMLLCNSAVIFGAGLHATGHPCNSAVIFGAGLQLADLTLVDVW